MRNIKFLIVSLFINFFISNIGSTNHPKDDLIFSINGHTWSETPTYVTFSPDGKSIMSGAWDTSIKKWDAINGKLIKKIKGFYGIVKSIFFQSNNNILIAVDDGWGSYNVWNLKNRKQIIIFEEAPVATGIGTFAFSLDGKFVATGNENSVKLWNFQSMEQITKFNGKVTVAFSHDSRKLMFLGYDKELIYYDIENAKVLKKYKGKKYILTSLTFSPDGKTFAEGSIDNSIKIISLKDGKILKTFQGHTGIVTSVAFSPDGKRLVSGSQDKTIKLWRVKDYLGRQIFFLLNFFISDILIKSCHGELVEPYTVKHPSTSSG